MRFHLRRKRSSATAQHVGAVVARADANRDAARFAAAAILYGEALALAPSRADLHIQRGHMLKESGNLAGAEQSYNSAWRLNPGDADLALQRGHFFKLAGRLREAAAAYADAAALDPGWEEPIRMLKELPDEGAPAPPPSPAAPPEDAARYTTEELDRLVPALAPRRTEGPPAPGPERIEMRPMGREEPSAAGLVRTLRGVEALRGFCITPRPILSIEILLDGRFLRAIPVSPPWPPEDAAARTTVAKQAFNIWLDCSGWPRGQVALEIRCVDSSGDTLSHHTRVRIAAPSAGRDFQESDGFVDLVEPDPALLEQRIRSLPSMVRPARRSSLPPLRNILVLRTDQLGDMVSSAPAMRRLRALAPEARLVGLVTAANVDLARTLALFDELIVIDFPDDPLERRRIMPLDEQEGLRLKLAPYAFDLAIDLAESNVSRELLLLSGAKVTHGVDAGGAWLTSEMTFRTHDPRNGLDRVPHAAKTLALVNALAGMIDTGFKVERRHDLDRGRLRSLGLDPAMRYVLLHAGARIAFSRWPHFSALAERVLERTSRHVVLLGAEQAAPETIAALPVSSRFHRFDGPLDFDDFDALLSFADVVVGNDSGPKHLAALRGVHVVTLFCARINWREWGQEEIGTIISRRVPCAGCAIFHDADECAKDFTCIRDIAVEEVFAAMKLAAPA